MADSTVLGLATPIERGRQGKPYTNVGHAVENRWSRLRGDRFLEHHLRHETSREGGMEEIVGALWAIIQLPLLIIELIVNIVSALGGSGKKRG